jgi:hypothetical protein
MSPLIESIREWHDTYMLFGTASATLIGLLFVAASVGSSFFNQEKHPALRAFLSPSLVHFTCVLAACLIVISPLRSSLLLGGLIVGDGLFGMLYVGLVWRSMVRHGFSATIDLEDRMWYAVLPAVGYMIMVVAGAATLAQQIDSGCAVLAVAMGSLTLVGIRNAWDMTVWTVVRRPD